MTRWQHAKRMVMLMVAAAVILGWVVSHSEPTFADGLRYIQRAERIENEGWLAGLAGSVDHPLHPLGIALAHRFSDAGTPASWQRAALVLSCACAIFLVIPVYLLTLELFGERSAWLACLLITVNPVVDDIVVNVLSESTFLIWWTAGLWCAARFLRGGRFLWLAVAIGLGGLAYLTRPEGMLLPAALAASLLISPFFRATRFEWRRWGWAVVFMAAGPTIVVGPYMLMKGGVGTKPGIARVLGLAPRAQPLALERGKPVPTDQSASRTYQLATYRMIKAFRVGVTGPLFPLAIFGLLLTSARPDRARAGLFLAIILAASALALVRLHATGGYCTARHALIPGMVLTLTAAHAITWLLHRIAIPGRWLGLARGCVRPGFLCQTVVALAFLLSSLKIQDLGPFNHGPYSVYHAAGNWLTHHARSNELILDMTGWPIFLSSLNGYSFADVYDAPADPATRWIVVRQPHVDGHWHYSEVIRELIGGRAPVAQLPPRAAPNQVQILIYDRLAPRPEIAAMSHKSDVTTSGH